MVQIWPILGNLTEVCKRVQHSSSVYATSDRIPESQAWKFVLVTQECFIEALIQCCIEWHEDDRSPSKSEINALSFDWFYKIPDRHLLADG